MTDKNELAQIGVVGLAVMGSNLARNFARNGNTVAVYNRSPEKTHALIEAHGEEGNFVPSETIEDFVASLERPRKAIIMVKAGKARKGDGMDVDHANSDPLNNSTKNLRMQTKRANRSFARTKTAREK